MKKVIILTGSELRHSFFRKSVALSDDVEVGNAVAKRGVVGSEEVPEVILDAMSERIGINHPRVGDSLNESAA